MNLFWVKQMIPKFCCIKWSCVIVRKYGHFYQVGIFLLFAALYILSSYYSFHEKLLPSQELSNETGYTETAYLLNTESSNALAQKQNEYERPFIENETVTVPQSIRIGDVSYYCGLRSACNSGEFSVHIYTGRDHRDEPRLCVDSKYIISKGVNDGGRGINVVVIDNITRSVVRVSHFDTYEKDSTQLEILLLTLRPGDIVILLTFDEPSRKLSRIARLLLYDLGSALIQNLSYRGSWYIITQKGIPGFSPYEKLHLVGANGWPAYHDVRFCVPFEIKGEIIHPDPLPSSNPKRVEFCEKFKDLPLFCDADVVNDPLSPAPVWKQPAAVNKIYDVPIAVISGRSTQFLPLTLETLIRQPGIKPAVVSVFFTTKAKMVHNLADVFGFMVEELSQSASYCERLAEALEITFLLFPDAKEVIVIGENAILSPDFLFFLGQLLPIMNFDHSIGAVSALNENGFRSVSGDPTLAYHSETFTGAGVLMRQGFFHRSLCKNQSVTDPMYVSSEIEGDILVPDVSRVTLSAPIYDASSKEDISSVLLSHERTITYEQNILLRAPERLIRDDYLKDIEKLLTSALPLEFDARSLSLCQRNFEKFRDMLFEDVHQFVHNVTNINFRVLVVYFHQDSEKDITTIQHLTQCFGLFYHPSHPVRGMYKGLLRFMIKDNPAFLVGSKSPFFHLKPSHVPVLRIDPRLGRLVNL